MKRLALKPLIKLRKGSRILDIGSGNNCLDRATHLMDLMPDSNAERASDLERVQGKEFRAGSIEAIPFSDGFFDFVHAAHVLEHVFHPERAISELVRVAAAGYIETPAASTEQGCIDSAGRVGWDFHRWYVWAFPAMDKLYLKPKTEKNLFEYCPCPFGQAYSKLVKITPFQELDCILPYDCKMTQFNWERLIPFEIWTEFQQGKISPSGLCNCPYSCFFAHAQRYFRSLRQIRRRREFRRKFPAAFELVRSTVKQLSA